MARPFDDSLPYQQFSGSMSSQTLLSGGKVYQAQIEGTPYSTSTPYTDLGNSWNSPRLGNPSSKKSSRPKLPKIKSSPSHGALAAARASHAKLHRRGNSAASTTQSPTSPTFVPDFLQQTSSSNFPASAHADPYHTSGTKSSSKSKVKIKPLLRKFSSQEKVSIDLSRSAAENEALGIYASSDINGVQSSENRRGYHHRTTSAASQLSSNTTSSNRYGTQYVHPMRQNPRSYTPPIANSHKTSLESEAPTVTTIGEQDFYDTHSRQTSTNTASIPSSYAPLPSSRRPTPLHIRTGSASRLNSPSQSNLPGTPSSLRFNTDAITPSEMISPATARSSFDSKFGKRSRSNTAGTSNEPIPLPQAVQAARQKYKEEQAAKNRKYEEAEAKKQEKEARRQEKREESERRTSEKRERNRARSTAASEKSTYLAGVEQHEDFPAVQMLSQDMQYKSESQKQRKRGDTAGSAGKAVHSQWSLFWFKFRTMWLRLKRKMSRSDST